MYWYSDEFTALLIWRQFEISWWLTFSAIACWVGLRSSSHEKLPVFFFFFEGNKGSNAYTHKTLSDCSEAWVMPTPHHHWVSLSNNSSLSGEFYEQLISSLSFIGNVSVLMAKLIHFSFISSLDSRWTLEIVVYILYVFCAVDHRSVIWSNNYPGCRIKGYGTKEERIAQSQMRN